MFETIAVFLPLAGACIAGMLAFARPDDLRFTDALPKTRSGKIMRRLLNQLLH